MYPMIIFIWKSPCFSLFLQSEYVSARDKRREFVSGFTGSAGQFSIYKTMKFKICFEALSFCFLHLF